MTTANQPTLRQMVEDFLFREAELLDDWRLDDWAALFTEDARYIVPPPTCPKETHGATWSSSTTSSAFAGMTDAGPSKGTNSTA